jgi:hypothetical protein
MGDRVCRMGGSPKQRTEAACRAGRVTEVPTVEMHSLSETACYRQLKLN